MNDEQRTGLDIEKVAMHLLSKFLALKAIGKVLVIGQILAFAGIFTTLRSLAKDLMYSIREPNYLPYIAKVILCIAAIYLFGYARKKLKKKRALKDSYVNIGPMPKNTARIKGNFLILEKDDGGKKDQMVFKVDKIHRLKSDGITTSFIYADPPGYTEFSCEDTYEPKIFELLKSLEKFADIGERK